MEPPFESRVIPLCTLIFCISGTGVLALACGLSGAVELSYDLQLAAVF